MVSSYISVLMRACYLVLFRDCNKETEFYTEDGKGIGSMEQVHVYVNGKLLPYHLPYKFGGIPYICDVEPTSLYRG